MVHKSKYMVLCHLKSVVVWIAHIFVDFCSYLGVDAYLRRERTRDVDRHVMRTKVYLKVFLPNKS